MTGGAVLLAGPTASGKSGLALRLADWLGGAGGAVILNADSMQVYRELRIITARPVPEEEGLCPHRLYGFLPAAEACSAARWRELAWGELDAAWQAGAMPIIVGGTGLYFRALTQGLSPIPDIPDDVRMAARDLHRRVGGGAFHDMLARRDRVMAGRLFPGDSQRLVRAWEVLEATGRSLAEWQKLAPQGPRLEGTVVTLLLAAPRDWLYGNCDDRFDRMIAAGAIDEVAALRQLDLDPGLPAMKALGVPEICDFLAGRLTLEEAAAKARMSTRRYAKRQLTWFRHQMPEAERIDDIDEMQRFDRARRKIDAVLGRGIG